MDGEAAAGDHVRCAADFCRGNAADRLGLLRGKVRDIGLVFLKAHAVLLNKGPVIKPIPDKNVRDGQGQGAVRSGIRLQMQIRHGGGGRSARVYNDDLTAPLLDGAELV